MPFSFILHCGLVLFCCISMWLSLWTMTMGLCCWLKSLFVRDRSQWNKAIRIIAKFKKQTNLFVRNIVYLRMEGVCAWNFVLFSLWPWLPLYTGLRFAPSKVDLYLVQHNLDHHATAILTDVAWSIVTILQGDYVESSNVCLLGENSPFQPTSKWEKICFTSLNQVNYLPQVSKPFTLPHCPDYKRFSKVVLSFQLKINLINIF
jgi:hypothetical protein